MQPSTPQFHRRAVARLWQRRQPAPRLGLDVQHKTVGDSRMTSRSDLTTHQIDKPLFAASYPGVCLRYIRRHRDPVRPSSLLEIQYINDAENSIDGLVTPNDEKLA